MPTMSENDVEALYDKLIAGWNHQDGAAMAEPFAEDGVVIGFDGTVSSGKQTINTDMASIFTDHETGRYVVNVRSVRALGPEGMIVRAIAGLVPPGQTAINSETNSHQTVVAERQAGVQWRIAPVPKHARTVPWPP